MKKQIARPLKRVVRRAGLSKDKAPRRRGTRRSSRTAALPDVIEYLSSRINEARRQNRAWGKYGFGKYSGVPFEEIAVLISVRRWCVAKLPAAPRATNDEAQRLPEPARAPRGGGSDV